MGNACSGETASTGFCCPENDDYPLDPAVFGLVPVQLESIEDAAQARARRRPPQMEKLPHDKWCHVANLPLFLPPRKVLRMPPGIMQLVHGAGLGLSEAVNNSLDAAVPVDVYDPMGWTAIHKAAAGGHIAVIRLLLARGAEVNMARPTSGATAVYIAAQQGQSEAISVLVAEGRGCDVDAADKKGATPIYVAAHMGYHDVIRLLVDLGADVNMQTAKGATPAHIAAQQGQADVIQTLADCGGNLALEDERGMAPIFAAANGGHAHVLKVLHAYGVDMNGLTRSRGLTAGYMAAMRGHHLALEALHAYGADLNLGNANGATPLHVAAQEGHTDALASLLKCGADVNAVKLDGTTALYIAAQQGCVKAVQVLIDGGADVDMANKNGVTPTYVAAQQGHAQSLKLLAAANAQLGKTNNNGFPPLFVATRGCPARFPVLQLLLDLGVSIDCTVSTKDKFSEKMNVWTVQRIAKSMQQPKVIELINLHTHVCPVVAAKQRRAFAWASKALDPLQWKLRDRLVNLIGENWLQAPSRQRATTYIARRSLSEPDRSAASKIAEIKVMVDTPPARLANFSFDVRQLTSSPIIGQHVGSADGEPLLLSAANSPPSSSSERDRPLSALSTGTKRTRSPSSDRARSVEEAGRSGSSSDLDANSSPVSPVRPPPEGERDVQYSAGGAAAASAKQAASKVDVSAPLRKKMARLELGGSSP